jgi:hypothetical protein
MGAPCESLLILALQMTVRVSRDGGSTGFLLIGLDRYPCKPQEVDDRPQGDNK